MGLISYYSVLNRRLVLGLRFRSAALRWGWGWDRCCHTNIISMPVKSMGSISSPVNPMIGVESMLEDDGLKKDHQEEEEEEEASSDADQQAMRRFEYRSLWHCILDVPCDDERLYDAQSIVNACGKYHKKEVPAGDLRRNLSRLRKAGRFYLALEFYEWMNTKGIYKFSAKDHAAQINLITKVRGFSAAERHVWNLPQEARNVKTYGELLHCYVNKHMTKKALFQFQKMKELGFLSSPCPFNEIMRLYAKSLQIEKVLGVMAELKKRSKVSPDNDSYRICISSFGLTYDMDGMERMLREMESQPHIVMDWCTYAVVAEFYDRGFLVDKATDALEKAKMMLQKKKKKNRRSYNLISSDYENVIKSLVKLGELGEAMKFVKEWELLGYWRSVDDISIPYTIIEEYIKNGPLHKARFRIWIWASDRKKGVDILSRLLCKEYLKVGDLDGAYSRFRGFGTTPLVVERSFFQYIEEECGSFFPLRCSGSLCCTRSLNTDAGETFLELTPLNVRYKFKVPLLVHPENSATQEVNVDYENIIKSLLESGELNEARKMFMGWEASGNLSSLDALNISKLIMEGYCNKSLFVEAEAMAEAWTREKKCWVGGIWLILACHYQEEGKLVRGFECMRRFWNVTPSLKDNHFMMMVMFRYMIEYSRGMNAAGYSKDREYWFFRLDYLLRFREDEYHGPGPPFFRKRRRRRRV